MADVRRWSQRYSPRSRASPLRVARFATFRYLSSFGFRKERGTTAVVFYKMRGESVGRRFGRKVTAGLAVAKSHASAKSGDGPDTKESEALAAALNHSAERVQTLWFGFLTVMVYLAIATGTTTHRMLFLDSPLNLPVLNIPLPLLGFYVLAPIIFVVFHFYMLLNLMLLARTAKSFEDALTRAFTCDGEPRENFRMRIENALFVQLLVGARSERAGINAKLLSLMALITLAVAPVALLLMIQIKFLPYHSEPITWFHRGLLALDLALVWTLWPGYRSGWGARLWPMRSWALLWPAVGSAAVLAYAIVVATFPGESIYVATHERISAIDFQLKPAEYPDEPLGYRPPVTLYSLISPVNTLKLDGEDLIDDAKLAHIIEKNGNSTYERGMGKSSDDPTDRSRWVATLPLKGRDLTDADLSGADVRHADFSGAILNGAQLISAWADNANFSDAQLRGAHLEFAQLQGAAFIGAKLQGASLEDAQLQGASLEDAQLQGAQLRGAGLQGANLDEAGLQGAILVSARLQAASLAGANLQGALLNYADLRGALLKAVRLQGATFEEAKLEGAAFEEGQVNIPGRKKIDLSVRTVCTWRADTRKAHWKDTKVACLDTDADPKITCEGRREYCQSNTSDFKSLKQLITEQVPSGERRRFALQEIEERLEKKDLKGQDEMAKDWVARTRSSPSPDVYEKSLSEQWRQVGCGVTGAPWVLQSLVQRLDAFPPLFSRGSKEWLAAAFLDNGCAGAQGLSSADLAKLKAMIRN